MVIPVGAPNPTAAYECMNYVYDAREPGADRRLQLLLDAGRRASRRSSRRQDPDAAKSDLIFPDGASTQQNCSTQPDPPAADEQEIEQAFQSLITGG